MVLWSKIGDEVYEIRYSVKKPDYLKYLLLVEHMINSFAIAINGKAEQTPIEIGTELEQRTTDIETPLLILKRRFAKGEITEEGYQRLRQIIES